MCLESIRRYGEESQLQGHCSLIGALVGWVTVARYDESVAGMDFAEGEVVLAFAIIALVAVG